MTRVASMHVRLGSGDTHYPDGLIPAATLLRLMSDCGTLVMLQEDGVSGLLAKWEEASFHEPVRVGEFVLIEGELTVKGNRSRTIACRVLRTVEVLTTDNDPYVRTYHPTPRVVADGVFVGVLPRSDQ